MDILDSLALSMGAGWASGINLYATVLVLGYLNSTGAISLPENLQILSHPLVLGAAGLMYCIEFFADKIPGVDNGWDVLHTFIRIPAGALLAANGVADIGPAAELAAGLIGAGLAATSHVTKAGSRVLINASPEPVSNWAASITEDVAVIGGLWAALYHPAVFFVALLIFLIAVAWLLPRLWRGIRRVLASISRFFGAGPHPAGPDSPDPPDPPDSRS